MKGRPVGYELTGERRRAPKLWHVAAIVLILGATVGVTLKVADGGDSSSISSGAPDPAPPATGSKDRVVAPSQRFVNADGSLRRLIYGMVASFNNDGPYVEPRAGQATRLAAAFRFMQAGKLRRASALVDALGYEVVRFVDRDSRQTVLVLRERAPRKHGWGMYVHAPRSTSNLVVEVTHPASDIKSERVGVETFLRTRARDLLVAGAKRDAAEGDKADVAHYGNTVFEAIHRRVVKSDEVVLQPHGFDAGERGEEYGQIVVSSGTEPSTLVRSLAENFTALKYNVCLYEPGRCGGLGATTNVQGASTRATGASFVHLELALPLRDDDAQRRRIVSVLTACFTRPLPPAGYGCAGR
jgi:hypothetical protein